MHSKTFALLAISFSLSLSPLQAGDGKNGGTHAIDLATALKLADADNTKIALAREKISQAEARLALTKTLMLPDIRAGASYHRHNGPIQETNGNVLDVDRSSSYAGLGAGAVGAGDVQIAGLGLNVDLGEAFYAPLAALQGSEVARSKSEAVRNQIHFEVAAAWYELLRARGALQIAGEAFDNATALADTTRSFEETGQGLKSDRERAAVEALVRQRDIEIARENLEIRSIKLAWLLRLDPASRMIPVGNAEARTDWVDVSRGIGSLTEQALADRPELAGSDAEIAATLQELNQRKYSPLIPKVSIGASTGGFGGDSDFSPGMDGNRTDVSALVFWQLNGLGLGYRAQVQERESLHRQARISRDDVEIAVAAEVAGALAGIRHRGSRIAIGREAVQRALSSYDLNRSRVFENQGLPIEVLQASQSLVTARTIYLNSVIDYNLSQFQLYAALGQPVAEIADNDQEPIAEAQRPDPERAAVPEEPSAKSTAPAKSARKPAGNRFKRPGRLFP